MPNIRLRLPELVSALSYALDLVEGQPPGHAVRTCIIGMRLGTRLGLNAEELHDLYYALLAKDTGCSANATRMCQIVGGDEISAKRAAKPGTWSKTKLSTMQYAWKYMSVGRLPCEKFTRMVKTVMFQKKYARQLAELRCDRGASIVLNMGLPEASAEAVRCLDEHWNGGGYPDGLCGEEIPVLARILHLSQFLEIQGRELGTDAGIRAAENLSGTWFDPELVKLAVVLHREGLLFLGLDGDVRRLLMDLEPPSASELLTEERIDDICVAFAAVVDAKSSYTFRHSLGVTSAAHAMAARLGLEDTHGKTIRRASLLHDIGKLSVPNSILEKPGKLTDAEWAVVRQHPYYTHQVLLRIPGFEEIAEVAASHHEKLDGSGYWRGLTAPQLSLPARLVVVADLYDALAANRPYRAALAPEQIFAILEKDTPHKLDADCVRALKESVWAGELELIENLRRLHVAVSKDRAASPAPAAGVA